MGGAIIIINTIGCSCSKEEEDKIPPLPPSGLKAQYEYNKVVLIWNASQSSDVASYNVYRDTTSFNITKRLHFREFVEKNFYKTIMGSKINKKRLSIEGLKPRYGKIGNTDILKYEDSTVEAGKIYYYRVTAVDGSGNESIPSEEVSATVPSVPACGNGICESGETSQNCPADCTGGGGGPVCGNGICEAGETSQNCPADCGVQGNICDSSGDAVRIVNESPADGSTISTGNNTFTFTVEYNLVSQLSTDLEVSVMDEDFNDIVPSQTVSVSQGCGTQNFNINTNIASGINLVYVWVSFPMLAVPILDVVNYIVNNSADWISITSTTPPDGSVLNPGDLTISATVQYNLSSVANDTVIYYIFDENFNFLDIQTVPISSGSEILNFTSSISVGCIEMVYIWAFLNSSFAQDIVGFPVGAPAGTNLQITPSALSFTASEGGSNPPPQNLSITRCGGSTEISWSASDDAVWLSLSPTSGTTPTSSSVSVDITGLTVGTYNGTITVTSAEASNSPVDVPVALTICSDDSYEEDDTYTQASSITVNGSAQSHYLMDPDFVSFSASSGNQYTIETFNLSAGTDTTLTLYDTDGTTFLIFDDDGGVGLASRIVWTAPASGTYYVMVDAFAQLYNCGESYDIRVTNP